MVDHRLPGLLVACLVATGLSHGADAETAEHRAIRAEAFEEAYKALDLQDQASDARFRELVAREVKVGISIDELLGFMIDGGLDCERVRLVKHPDFQPPVKYQCSHNFVSKEEADRLAWSSISMVNRVEVDVRIDENRIVTAIDAWTKFGLTGP